MSRRSMATMLTLGFLAISFGQPAFADARSSGLRGNSQLSRNLPTVPTTPTRPKGDRIHEGRQTRACVPLELDGTTYGAVRTLLNMILR